MRYLISPRARARDQHFISRVQCYVLSYGFTVPARYRHRGGPLVEDWDFCRYRHTNTHTHTVTGYTHTDTQSSPRRFHVRAFTVKSPQNESPHTHSPRPQKFRLQAVPLPSRRRLSPHTHSPCPQKFRLQARAVAVPAELVSTHAKLCTGGSVCRRIDAKATGPRVGGRGGTIRFVPQD